MKKIKTYHEQTITLHMLSKLIDSFNFAAAKNETLHHSYYNSAQDLIKRLIVLHKSLANKSDQFLEEFYDTK
jgi:hypothetical protein